MTLSLAIPNFLMFALALQGFVLSGVLFYSSRKIKSNKWISLLIFCISIEAIIPILPSLIPSDSLFNYLFFPTNLALGPLIYFYTRSLIFGEAGLPRKKYLYFLALLIDLKHQIIFLLYTSGLLSIPFFQNIFFSPQVQNLLFGYSNGFIFLSMLSMIIYLIISYRLINKNKINQETSSFKLADVKWLKSLLIVLFGLSLLWFFTIIAKNIFNINWGYYLVFIPVIIFIHWLGFKAYLRQSSMAPVDIEVYNKPVKVYFSDEEKSAYSKRLDHLMTVEKLYLDPLLKLDDLAEKLGLPEKQVSNLINQHLGKNFNDFINSYRVEEAMKNLADPALSQFTIAALAFDCGFNSLATFQRCFKQFTGLTPSQYQNSLKLNIAGGK
jgi:AraC-like DNA-binding protein